MSPEAEKSAGGVPDKWLVTTSPHVRSPEMVSQIMWTVVLALLPSCVAGLVVFGWYAGLVMALGVLSAMLSEALVQRALGRQVTVSDGSAAVTGLLLAMCLPPNVLWYVPVIGSFVAVFVGKQVFGGLGRNYFNPALLGRAFLQFAFPGQLSQPKWPVLMRRPLLESVAGNIFKVASGSPAAADAMSMATPLATVKPPMDAGIGPLEAVKKALYNHAESSWDVVRDLALGNIPGCIGEVSKLALLLGGLILIANRYVNWRLPLSYILTALVMVLVLPVKSGGGWSGVYSGSWSVIGQLTVIHLLSGGLFLGAFFMITDMVTSPTTSRGQVLYGIAAGVLVALIRVYGGYPEGVCYSILLVNAGRLLVEKISVPRVFGTGRGVKRA
ncbi:MAG: RnfABCDGE type electron transport complex subunit D [Planctomycetota bacterium]